MRTPRAEPCASQKGLSSRPCLCLPSILTASAAVKPKRRLGVPPTWARRANCCLEAAGHVSRCEREIGVNATICTHAVRYKGKGDMPLHALRHLDICPLGSCVTSIGAYVMLLSLLRSTGVPAPVIAICTLFPCIHVALCALRVPNPSASVLQVLWRRCGLDHHQVVAPQAVIVRQM